MYPAVFSKLYIGTLRKKYQESAMSKLTLMILVAVVVCCFSKEDNIEPIIGIDLGTTYSCVGVYKHSRVEIIANDQGNRITPSYVAFEETGERLIGDGAKNQITRNPINTIFDVKRLIGRTWDDATLQTDIKNFPFKVIGKDNKPYIEVDVGGTKKTFAPEEVSAMVLMKMKETAESYIGKTIKHAVVTVPAYFNDAQRRATRDAGTIAGLNVSRIINEPTAAAIAYGLDRRDDNQNILIFDLGGGTFDVSLMTINNGIFKTRAVDGDTHLGGEDFDQRVINHFIKVFKSKTKQDIGRDNRAIQRLRREVEKAKRVLSYKVQARIEIEYLSGGYDFSEILTRAKFEEINMDLFRMTMKPLQKVLDDSGVAKENVDEVVLVGGSTRIPKVQQLISEFFNGKEPSKGINQDEAVSYGAAVLGGILNGEDKIATLVLQDVTPLTLGIAVRGQLMAPVIRRNTEIPCTKVETFTTTEDDLTFVNVEVFEGERPLITENHYLGEFTLHGVTPRKAGVVKLDVSFDIDINGILKVSAVEGGTDNTAGTTISSDRSSLSTEEIERMINDAKQFAEEDETEKRRIVARNRLEQFAYSIRGLYEDGGLSETDLNKVINAANEQLRWLVDHPDEQQSTYNDRYFRLRYLASPHLVGKNFKDEL